MMVHWGQRFDIQPHRVEKFKLSNDPQFEEKVRDIAGLYLDPPERALVLWVDEKSQMQALDRTAPILPWRPGLPERQTHDSKRYGTTTLLAAFHILNGKVIGRCWPRPRGKEFAKFLNQVEKQVPPDLDVHILLDNYSTHQSATVQQWLKPRKRRHFHFHFTPTSRSWLHEVERRIRRGTFRSVAELEWAIYAWLANWNNKPQPFVWKATADVILDKARRCKEFAGTPHERCIQENTAKVTPSDDELNTSSTMDRPFRVNGKTWTGPLVFTERKRAKRLPEETRLPGLVSRARLCRRTLPRECRAQPNCGSVV
jgi:hypothetical protein